MKDYYEISKKEFINYIKKNPYVTRAEWDEYAHENCLFSAFTLICHEINDNTLEKLQKQNINQFQFLKEMYIIIPNQKMITLIDKIKKSLNLKKKEQETNVKR